MRQIWEQKTEQTVERVDAAVNRLRNDGAKSPLAAICSTVLDLYGFRMSTNTILRNARAYGVYRNACTPAARRCSRETELNSLLHAASGTEKARLQSQSCVCADVRKRRSYQRSSGANVNGRNKP